jgi:hypothetical protein
MCILFIGEGYVWCTIQYLIKMEEEGADSPAWGLLPVEDLAVLPAGMGVVDKKAAQKQGGSVGFFQWGPKMP